MPRRKNEIRSVDELPRWFRIGLYSDTHSLDNQGWFDQLAVRTDIYRYYEHQARRFKRVSVPIDGEIIGKIRSQPIAAISNDDVLIFFTRSPLIGRIFSLRFRTDQEKTLSKGVHTITHMELFDMCGSVPRDKWSHLEKVRRFEKSSYEDNVRHPGHQPWVHDPCGGLPNDDLMRCAVVNLSLPDDLLRDRFEEWLAAERKRNNEDRRRFSRYEGVNPSAWAKYAVLPYLDLTIWALETGVSIPDRVMEDAIFPLDEQTGNGEKVRRETKPRADVILGYGQGVSPLFVMLKEVRPTESYEQLLTRYHEETARHLLPPERLQILRDLEQDDPDTTPTSHRSTRKSGKKS